MTKTEVPIAQYLTPQEVADQLNVTAQTIINMCRRRELDHVSWGSEKRKNFRIHPDAIEKLRTASKPEESEVKTPDLQQINEEADEILDRWRTRK
ncbi:MAG: helix-turn-helix domain-containing protein [Pirellulales bacterium]